MCTAELTVLPSVALTSFSRRNAERRPATLLPDEGTSRRRGTPRAESCITKSVHASTLPATVSQVIVSDRNEDVPRSADFGTHVCCPVPSCTRFITGGTYGAHRMLCLQVEGLCPSGPFQGSLYLERSGPESIGRMRHVWRRPTSDTPLRGCFFAF